MIKTENLCYDLGSRALIKSVNLQLKSGQLTVLIGPNGAGKTTLLRLLTGFLKPSAGHCMLNGRDIAQWSPLALAKVRAVMQQHHQLNFPFTVREVVAMGGSPHRQQDHLDQIMQQTECDNL
ncbi:ATP-binding cassette domain-containing protein [Orbaceae bacterium ESL0721]|nr:ATP-binding cassette domain-containing protein [Orbaceae bacterium ESL0721]